MSDLLTAKDVELKIFKKASFGGYSIPDVEEFLNQIAEDLEAYALRQSEQQRRVFELEEAVKRHEAMKDTIKDALILAQKSAKEKEDEAKRQAELILAQAEAKIGECDLEGQRRIEEAQDAADKLIAEAQESAAHILKNAEELKEEAQKRIENVEAEIAQRLTESNDQANDITAAAHLEARRVTGKIKYEIEESKRELSALQGEKRRFLRDAGDLLAAFTHVLDEMGRKLEKGNSSLDETEASKQETTHMTLPFSPIPDDTDEIVLP